MLYHQLREQAERMGEKVATNGPDVTLSYKSFITAVDAFAAELSRYGIKHGDRVSFLGFNSTRELLLFFACAKIGAIFNPLNWRLTPTELTSLLADADPVLLVSDESFANTAKKLSDKTVLIDKLPLQSVAQQTSARVSGSTDALLVYTSGATDRPKGAVHTHSSVLANARNSVDMHGMTSDDHILTVLPFFHVGGLNIQTVPALLIGATVSLTAKFDPSECLTLINSQRPTLTVQVPATFAALMAQKSWNDCDLGCFRAIATGSTDVPVDLIKKIEAKGTEVIQIYGSTETGPVVIYQKAGDANNVTGSVGKSGPFVEAEIRNAKNGVGNIVVKSDALAVRYWPDLPLQVDGWFDTGDFGRLDDEGLYWYTDRSKNLIISGGENVYPTEIERVLATVKGIQECAVVGLKDDKWGQVPVAAIVGEPDQEGLKSTMDQKLARFKHPKKFLIFEALPRNAMGKVVPEQVLDQIKQKLT